ncbi:LCP family protein [Halanaerocella petrolearia]
MIVSGVGGYLLLNSSPLDSVPKEVKKDKAEVKLDDKFNILLLGSDAKLEGRNRTDTIIVVSIDLNSKLVGLLSIPRDSRVKIAGDKYSDYHKINAAYSYGGLKLMQETLEEYLEIPLDYYLQVDYQGFVALVDTLGGVEINVEKDLHYVDQAAGLNIDLQAGKQRLTGEQALNYVRFRHDALGDIGRIKRQQKFLQAALKEFLSLKTILKVPKLINKFSKYVATDLELAKMMKLANLMDNFSLDQIAMEMLPGSPKYIEGVSYWLPNPKGVKGVVNSLLKTKSYFRNQGIELSILNGSGTSGLAGQFADLLVQQGYQIKKVGNAEHFNYNQNIIIAPVGKVKSLQKLARYLDAKVINREEGQQVEVIIGQRKINED